MLLPYDDWVEFTGGLRTMFFTVKAYEVFSKPYFSMVEMGSFNVKEGCLFPLANWIQLSILWSD